MHSYTVGIRTRLNSPVLASESYSRVTLPESKTCDQPTGIFINNKCQASAGGLVFDTVNPYTQAPICSIARGKGEDINLAVAAAQNAFKDWSRTTTQQRGRLLGRLADLIERDVDLLAKIEVRAQKFSLVTAARSNSSRPLMEEKS